MSYVRDSFPIVTLNYSQNFTVMFDVMFDEKLMLNSTIKRYKPELLTYW